MEKEWRIRQPDAGAVADLHRRLGCHPVTAALLVSRGLSSADAAHRFLQPSLADLREPFAIAAMGPAVERIAAALAGREKILVFGDYDVDGVTATALLCEFLTAAGGRVSYHIPHRTREGYGLKPSHVRQAAADAQATLIITADCGSSDHEAALAARAAGIDLVVTDHHEIPAPFPDALAVVNPKRGDCPAGFDHLAGVGVVFCLLICLRKHLRDRGYWQERPEPNLRAACDLVALGTVADMVPLVAENRILTRTGLAVINDGGRPGVRALAGVSRIVNRPVDGDDIAFRLAPRINAAGRMETAAPAVELLMTRSAPAAEEIARSLERLNLERQGVEKQMLEEILDALGASPERVGAHSLVLAGPDWHEGVLGIVASRLVAIYHRPVVLAGIRDGVARGSARGIPGIDLYGLLCGCADLLEAFGGHSRAAGLRMPSRHVDRFRQCFEARAAAAFQVGHLAPTVAIDGELGLNDISDGLIDELEAMRPFGEGNPEPLFMARDLKVHSAGAAGLGHRRMELSQASGNGGRRFQSIRFNAPPLWPPCDRLERIAFRLRWNRWNGRKTAQIVVAET